MKNKSFFLFITLFFLASAFVQAQTPGYANRIIPVNSLPATCNPLNGDVVFLVTASAGIYACVSANTWQSQTPTSSFNVQNFGAKCNGVADDTAAINNAISMALLLSSRPKVSFPAGVCNLSASIAPSAGVLTLEGAAPIRGYGAGTLGGTTLTWTAGTVGISANSSATDYLNLINLDINGNGVLNYGLQCTGQSRIIRNCHFTGCVLAGADVTDYANQLSIEDSSFCGNGPAGAGVGLIIDGANSTIFSIKSSNFRQNYRGLVIKGGNAFSVTDSVIESNNGEGLVLDETLNYALSHGTFTNVWFEANDQNNAGKYQLLAIPGGNGNQSSTFMTFTNCWFTKSFAGSGFINLGNLSSYYKFDRCSYYAAAPSVTDIVVANFAVGTVFQDGFLFLASAQNSAGNFVYLWPGMVYHFADLTTFTPAANGSMGFCADCTVASPCAGSGTGAIAKRLNGAWVCN